MSRPDEDAEAPTLAASTLPERSSRPALVDDGLAPGQELGRYRLRARLGAGAMGVVWSARDPQLDRDVAIKVVHPAFVSPEAATRFSREARAMAKLSHRSVVPVYDTGEVDGRLFLVMELVDGETLGRVLRRRDAADVADWRRWLDVMLEAGRGLAAAHRQNVLHRDFKPDNVLVDKTGRVCVGDFGLATLGEVAEGPGASRRWTKLDLTTTGALLGTPLYMSPQQLRGEPVDHRADQFAFCVATYEALYGTRPFQVPDGVVDEATIDALLEAIERHELAPPPAGSTVPAEVRDVLARGLSPELADRWDDIDALLDALARAAKRRSPTVVAHRRRRGIAVVAVIVGVALAVLAFVELRSSSPPDTDPPPAIPRQPVVDELFNVPLRTQIAISPDGKLFATGGDHLMVGEIAGNYRRRADMPRGSTTSHLEFDGDSLVFSVPGATRRYRWRFRTSTHAEPEPRDLGGVWLGTTVAGDLLYLDAGYNLGVVGRDGVVQRWSRAEVVALSPDRRRVAYIENGRFTGTIVVRDVTKPESIIRSAPLDEPVALAWRDDTTLLYAIGTLDHPQIRSAIVDDTSCRLTSDVILEEPVGWYGALAFGGGRLLFQEMRPQPNGRMVDLEAHRSEDLDSVILGIGWASDGELITWDRGVHEVEVRAYSNPSGRRTGGRLGAEPANATTAGNTLIATLRQSGGRDVVAYSLAHSEVAAAPLWRGDDRRTLAVRCAGDRAPPCYALRLVSETRNDVVTIDPVTGALGTDPVFTTARIEDIAISPDGKRMYVVGPDNPNKPVRVVDLATRAVSDIVPIDASTNKPHRLMVVRSVAVGADGTVFIASTVGRNLYEVGSVLDGRYTRLAKASDQVLAFVRLSPDRKRLVFVARSYAPKLRVMTLP